MTRKALIVDDELELGQLLAEHLRRWAFDPIIHTEGKDAVTWARQEKLEVILLDLMLAGESGRDLLAELVPRGTMPPTVLVSASHDAPTVAQEFGLRLVAKPFDIDVLVDTVRTTEASSS